MKSNKVVFLLLNCFISRGIFAQITVNRNEGVETANKPNRTEKLSIAKCSPEKQLIQKINIVETISTPCPKKQLASTLNATIPFNLTSFCHNGKLLKKIIRKENGCGDYDKKPLSFTEFPVFNKFLHETDKKINEHFNLVGPEVMNITNFSKTKVMNPYRYHMYIMEDSTLVIEKPNQVPWARWNKYDNSFYCIDYFKWTKTGKITPHYFLIQENVEPPVVDYYRFPVMLVSCVFLLLVLVVYWMLPELRNLRGLILMSYVASLLTGFAFFAAMNIISNLRKSSTVICKTFTFVIYFCMLSSFFWTNVMSLDIWWTFRGFANIRQIHRRGEWCKYLVYCFYAWGVPLLMAAALIVVNETDMKHLPWFVTPQITNGGCFISEFVPIALMFLSDRLTVVDTSVRYPLKRKH